MDSLEDNLYISVQYCSDIEEYVFGIFNDEGDKGYYNRFSSLVLLDEKLIPDYDIFITNIEKLYQKRIMARTFSKINGIWSPYSIDDKNKINLCISN